MSIIQPFFVFGPTSYLHHFSYAAPICILLEALIFYIKAWICRKIEHGRTWQLSSMRRLLFEAHDLPSMFSKRVCYDFFNRCHKWCKIEWFESSGWQMGCFFYTNIVFYVIWLMFFIYSMFYVFSVFSMFSQLTPRSAIQDGSICRALVLHVRHHVSLLIWDLGAWSWARSQMAETLKY